MSKSLNLELVLATDQFKVFTQEYDRSEYSQTDIKFLFLKGYQNYPIHLIARFLSLRYSEALKTAKKLEVEINNIRADKRLAILHKEKVSSDHVWKMKARQLKGVMDELEKRSSDEGRFKDLSEKQLFDLMEKLESGTKFESEYHTGEVENGSFPMEKLYIQD